MKFALLVGDGMADYPLEELGGRTPLEAAGTPNMDRLAREGIVGLVRTIPPGTAPGSDIANLNLLGYDVAQYYSGRAPLEAASRNLELAPGDVAFRCNLVTVEDGVMLDYSAGHITSEEASELIAAIDDRIGTPSLKFHPGVSYRHLLIVHGEIAAESDRNLMCTPPHDIVGRPIAGYLPVGQNETAIRKLMSDSVGVLSEHSVNRKRLQSGKKPANMIWLWGQGKRPSMPSFSDLYGLNGAVISAVDLIRGLGKYAGLEVVEVPGVTGYFDTNYAGKAGYGLEALKRRDFLFVHVEAPDEAGHVGDVAEKIRAIENFDKMVVGPIADGISHSVPHRVMVLPDHLTPIRVRTHVGDPVPFLVWGTGILPGGAATSGAATSGATCFSEASARKSGLLVENGYELLPRYLMG
ncbi:cofactor-independent phosphoglycerate mutase [Candidatus Poribacteria bacterium]|nr:cofactor-independent phosphoglycerate mutase [Candidatus Poribacteria bacterium]